jgi:hypothetical protein
MRQPVWQPIDSKLSLDHMCWLPHFFTPEIIDGKVKASANDKIYVVAYGVASGIYYERLSDMF